MAEFQSPQSDTTEDAPKNQLILAAISLIAGICAVVCLALFASTFLIKAELTILWLMLAITLSLFGFMLGLLARRSTKGAKLASAGIILSSISLLVMVVMPVYTVIYYFR
ncbi:hypothetical protein PP175_10045 [Aneurinibacillus sp. Ricciae_BoGa-3]|uniref:hypothetical protein n=1 Tax=Aneurinibacillus sp. Ricciae_BoGa-3 TaxID=3022697 RepID=UPI0023426A61|nr:hypothetical protein [Aneurinibacillus sp. Ricciae_BoGa-3]WCK56221.1 hypothetical protein PP175_10045 [Aneurinibacillus sp. Ricciae_BoGa-3]